MQAGDTDSFETIVSRSALLRRVGWGVRAALAGTCALLLWVGVAGGVLGLGSPPPGGVTGERMPWQAVLVAVAGALWFSRSSARAGLALARGTREVVGVISHAKELTHAGQRASYRLWHVALDGREHTFAPSELRGSGAARLVPGQRAKVRLVGGSELVLLAVHTGMPVPRRASLPSPRGTAAPLSENDIAQVTAWASRRVALFLAFLVALVALVASRGGPVSALHAIFAVMIGGLAWGGAASVRLLLAARALAAGSATRYLDGALRRAPGLLSDTYVGIHRVADAGASPAPRPVLPVPAKANHRDRPRSPARQSPA